MKIIRGYILKELVLPFLISLVTLSFIFMAGYLVRAANFIIGRGVPLGDTLYVIMLAMPRMLSYTVPMSLLTSVMIVFGSLSQYNEVRAFKASGVHPYHIMVPAFLMGLLLSFGMFVFNDQVANEAGFHLRKITKQLIIKHPRALIEAGRFVRLSDQVIFLAKRVEGDSLHDIVAYEIGPDDEPVRTIIAERGELITLVEKSAVTIRLYRGSISDSESEGVQSIQFKTYEFPSFGQEDVNKMQKKIKDFSLADLIVKLQNNEVPDHQVTRFWTAFHDRIAFAFGSLIFAFIGVPIAILVKRGEAVISFAISMMAACIYYILFVGAKSLAIRGTLPAGLALWLPNMILFVLGCFLVRKSINS